MSLLQSTVFLLSIVFAGFCVNSASSQTINDFNRYWTYDEIRNYVNGLPARFSYVQVDTTMSTELRQIQMVRIRVPHPQGQVKPIVLISSGHIAREWVNVMVAVHFIFQVTENNAMFREILEQVDFHVIPLLNPDGYVFSHTTDRHWVKNRFLNPDSACIGVNVNRNFAGGHANNPHLRDPCSDEFGDRTQMTQVEQRAIMNWVRDHWSQLRGYANIEGFGSRLLFPFANNPALNTHRREAVEGTANEMLATINAFTNQPFITGMFATVFQRSFGNAIDQFHDVSSIHRSYAIHPRAAGPNGYDALPTQLMSIINEVFPGLIHFGQIIGRDFGGAV